MSPQKDPSSVDLIQEALNRGDIASIRELLFRLPESEMDKLRMEMGDIECNRLLSSARKVRRGQKRGRVILLHGIMGSMLEVERGGDVDRVWTQYWHLFNGRIEDLELTPAGDPAPSGVRVRVAGQDHKYYLPLLLELDREWHVQPFAYDWREDIAKSAHRLAAEVKSFGNGSPVHLVAHSMGGLVSRAFIRLYGDLWKAMADPQDLASGGRLVMLGTPNRGSYAIPLALSGGEKLVRMLALLDRKHDVRQVLTVLNSFPGSYQMLPSPLVQSPDNHQDLFKAVSWGSIPINKDLLERAAEFHRSIKDIVDAKRFLYVAGCNRETPFRIRVEAPGRFSYQSTQEGDGRVPHELGLLEGVQTFWIEEDHGSLARNADVLHAIHEVLAAGKTEILASVRPAMRRVAADAEWRPADEFERIPVQMEPLLKSESRGRGHKTALSWKDQVFVENLLLADYLGRPRGQDIVTDRSQAKAQSHKSKPAATLKIQVVWGDICSTEGDVYCVGHYQGVLPQYAEFALDRAMSGTEDQEHQVLRQYTIQGTLKGALGDVNFFPWGQSGGKTRTVAVAGMGYPGSFGAGQLLTLTGKLAWAISNLPAINTVCTVLIGSGEGTLSVQDSVFGLIRGIANSLMTGHADASIKQLKIIELYRHRAVEILEHVKKFAADPTLGKAIKLQIEPEIVQESGKGRIANEDALELLLKSAMIIVSGKDEKSRDAAKVLLKAGNRDDAELWKLTRKYLSDLAENGPGIMDQYRIARRDDRKQQEYPTRISFLQDGNAIRVAAISETATVSERILRFDPSLLQEAVNKMNDPDKMDLPDVSDFLTRLLFPSEFRDLLKRSSKFVFEVDRKMAQVHWEILMRDPDESGKPAIGVTEIVSRQLRTSYSPPPLAPRKPNRRLRALVVGDPGDPGLGHNLPGAMEEALRVREILSQYNVEVVPLIGAPSVARTGRLRGIAPAHRSDVLHLLMRGGFDILHYSGHGDFDEEDPEQAGWIFASGLLTARELERMEEAPALIVANACLSARQSQVAEGSLESALLPSLADEFFRRGVRNYIGTAWEVSDLGAILFAEKFYEKLLGAKSEIGEAVQSARAALYAESSLYGNLWAAYQHYGDPMAKMQVPRLDAAPTT
jgi:pimeloyl-ACP methyl ester carboxylesterase